MIYINDLIDRSALVLIIFGLYLFAVRLTWFIVCEINNVYLIYKNDGSKYGKI